MPFATCCSIFLSGIDGLEGSDPGSPRMGADDSQNDLPLKAKLDAVGVHAIQRHIFLCCDQTKPKCSTREQSLKSWEYLKRRLVELKLVGKGGVYRTKANCLQVCEQGPVAVRLPRRDLVPNLHARRAGADHSRTLDRWCSRGRVRYRHPSTADGLTGRCGNGARRPLLIRPDDQLPDRRPWQNCFTGRRA